MTLATGLQPARTIAELEELRTLTGNADGAQRVAFTETWVKAREWIRAKLDELPVEVEMDEAGNVFSSSSHRLQIACVIEPNSPLCDAQFVAGLCEQQERAGRRLADGGRRILHHCRLQGCVLCGRDG